MEEEIVGLPEIKTLQIPDSNKLTLSGPSLSVNKLEDEEEKTSLDKSEDLATSEKILNSFKNIKLGIQGFDERLVVGTYTLARKIFGDEAIDKFAEDPEKFSFWKKGLSDEDMTKALTELKRLESLRGETGQIAEGIKEGDAGEIFAGVVNALTSFGESFAVSVPTLGAGIYTDFYARAFMNVNEEKAKQRGLSVQEFVTSEQYQDDVDYNTPLVTGIIAGGLEKFGLSKVTKPIINKIPQKGLAKLGTRLTSGFAEGATEYGQTLTEKVEQSIGQGKTKEEVANDFVEAMFTQEAAESFLQGLVGGGIITTTGTLDKKEAKTVAIATAGLTAAATLGGDAVLLAGSIPIGNIRNAAARLRSEADTKKIDDSFNEINNLQQKLKQTKDNNSKKRIQNRIQKLRTDIDETIKRNNNTVNQVSEKDLKELSTIKDLSSKLNEELRDLQNKFKDNVISEKEYNDQRELLKQEFQENKKLIDTKVSDISAKNKRISEESQKNIEIIKNPNSSEAQIESAKNKLAILNEGMINKIVNQSFNAKLNTSLTKEDLKASISLEFSNLINSYKIDSGVPFGAYAAQNLPKRLAGVFDKLVETKITKEGEREIISKQDITEVQIEDIVEQVEIDKPTITKLKTSLKLDDAIVNKVVSAVKKVFGTSLPEVTDKSFKKELTTSFKNELTDLVKKGGVFGNDNIEFKKFITENAKNIYNSLPLSEMTKTFKPFVEKVLDPVTGKPLREATKEGKNIFKKKDFNDIKDEFINYFTDTKLGSSTRSDRKTSIAKQIADQLARDEVVDIITDPEVSQKFKDIQELEGKIVPEDFLDRIVRSIDRGIEYLNKIQKSDKLYVGLGFPELAIQGVKLFLQTAKITLQAGKSLNIAFKKGIESAQNLFDTKEEKSKIKEILERNYKSEKDLQNNKVIENTLNEIDSIDQTEVGWKNVEENILNNFIELANKDNNINIKQTEIAKNNNKNIDVQLTYNGKKIGIEVKKNDKAFFGSPGRLTGTINDLKTNSSLINQLLRSNNPDIKLFFNNLNKWIKRAEKLDNIKIDKFVTKKLSEETISKLQKENLQAAVGKTNINIPISAIRNYYKTKDINNFTGEYIIIDNKLYSLGNDPLNTNAPLLEGEAYVNIRLKKDRGSFALVPDFRIKNISNKSNISLNNLQDFENAFLKEDKNLSKDINQILEETKNIPADEIVSEVRAKVNGKKAEKIRLFVPYTAEDFLGLLYQFAGKGKQGDRHLAWIKENLTDPLSKGLMRFEASQQASNKALKAVKKIIKDLNIDLGAEAIDGFTNDQAIRVFLWNKNGYDIKGISSAEIDKINKYVRANLNELQFSDELENVYPEGVYPEPTPEWLAGTLTTDLLNHINTETRSESLQEFFDNVNDIFGNFDKNKGRLTGENTNKIRSIYGDTFIKALESALYRISTGRNRSYQLDHQGNLALNWLNDSVGTIMFFNTRSAILQTISAINFTNWTDNNPLMQAKAFANQKQFWNDFAFLFNSDYLKERRSGLRTDINADEIASSAEKSTNKIRAAISTILKKGFLPTQIADSFAISIGGASFYRNRLDNYIKQGLEKAEAEERAFQDFREISETSQQSSRPDKISMEQASFLGRLVLAFQNTPMQYNRLMKKAILDLTNNRGDWKTNLSKIMYYGAIQNALFYALQQGLFALLFDDEDEEKEKDRYFNLANGMADSILRGAGIFGAIVSTLKNASFKTIEELEDKRPDYTNVIQELSGISPPLNSKFRKLRSAGRKFTYRQEKEKMRELGLDTKNPAILAGAEILSAGLNIPADRALYKINNLRDASDSENEYWQRIALALGWNKWSLGMTDNNQTQPKTSGLKTKKLKTKSLKTKKLKN